MSLNFLFLGTSQIDMGLEIIYFFYENIRLPLLINISLGANVISSLDKYFAFVKYIYILTPTKISKESKLNNI